MSRILFVTDQLPFPPRNGITITSANSIMQLAKDHEVSLLWLSSKGTNRQEEAIKNNSVHLKHLWVAQTRQRAHWFGLGREMLSIEPCFIPDAIDIESCSMFQEGYDCDVLWGIPLGAFSLVKKIADTLPTGHKRTLVAGINDCLTGAYRSCSNRLVSPYWILRDRGRALAFWLRSWLMASMEREILEEADRIAVQTEWDKEWLGRISQGCLLEKVVVIPNGTNTSLLEVEALFPTAVIGHIGSLSLSHQARTMRWILNDVLPGVRRSKPDVKFSVLGKSGPRRLMERLKMTDGVQYTGWVDDMGSFYDKVCAVIIRSYTGMGLISRTLEAMAAGVVVVGDRGAFNGINGFQDGIHGFLIEDESRAAEVLLEILSNEGLRTSVSRQARELIRAEFDWAERRALLNQTIESCSEAGRS